MERYNARNLDELGRIVLPSELRKDLDWNTNDKIIVYRADENTVILQNKDYQEKKKQQAVIFTGSDEGER